ncbi:WG repeat-containing protein [Melissospora conviva]|uniref:WG repeat-containing protein n=1 Tax=Melissospora conviva TaxID=3388432 RepID=UPI003B8028F0
MTAGEWRPQPDASPEPAPTADAAPQPTAQASATTTTDPFPVSADAPAPVTETDTPAGSGSGEISGADSSPGPEPTAAAAAETTQPAAETKPAAEAPTPATDAQAPDRDSDSPADAHTGEVPDTESADGSTASAETAPVAGTPATDEQRQDTTAPEPDADDSNENGDQNGDGDGDGDGDQNGDGDGDGDEAPIDPEQWLAAYRPRLDPETLRESAADPAELSGIRDRLSDKIDAALDNRSRARLLSLRAVVSRLAGDLDRALDDGQLALTHAQATGELRRIAIAQARLAHVLRCRGDFAEADRLYAEANSPELPDRLRAALHEQMARSCYDQDRYIEACVHFERALDLRRTHDRDLLARTEVALDGVFARVAARGWGPYARSRDEVLQKPVLPVPHFDAGLGRWGYADATGELVIDSRYAEAQPFREDVAWVRNPDARCWELIDRSGAVLIGADAGFREAQAFSDELAWVRRADEAQWLAVDRTGAPAGPAGFDDVRPFRRGVAVVRKGRWGAVNSAGELVLAPSFDGFATALTDGRYLDGFTDEGLAVVDAGGRKGVVHRDGRMLVRPAHPAVVIHPVAFLIGDGRGRWGALDRRGDLLLEVVHGSRATVLERIDRLLADTEPLL